MCNNTLHLRPEEVAIAAEFLKQGQLVAFATETVYGLGASAFDAKAILEIFRVKGRPSDNPLIVHVHSLEQVDSLAVSIPPSFYLLAAAFWPGPLTMVLERKSILPGVISAGLNSVAVRMPSHPLALELLRRVGVPLVAPSANLSGKPSPTEASHVLEDLAGLIAAVLDGGRSEVGIESTVIDLRGPVPYVLRPGCISTSMIEGVLGSLLEVSAHTSGDAPASPGMKYRHYSPKCPVLLFEELVDLEAHRQAASDLTKHLVLIPSAHNLYEELRRADREGYNEVLVLCTEQVRAQEGLMNRLIKAAGKL
jgi:L-threonylcarbamoyladenylate synthase